LLDLGKELQQSLASGPDQIATTMLSQVGRMSAVELSSWSGGGRAAGVIIGDLALSVAEFDHLRAAAGDLVKQFQEEHPLEPGMGLGALATELSISPEVARHLVDRNEELQLAGSVVARTGVVPKEAVSDSRWLTTRDSLRGLAPPSIAETGLTAELLRALVRSGELIRVSDDFVYLPESIEQLLSVIRSFEAPFSVSDFRTRAGISRKYAVPVLEYTDREGITMRQGDLRTVRR
jgi:selenocysteine-specific elongation factor